MRQSAEFTNGTRNPFGTCCRICLVFASVWLALACAMIATSAFSASSIAA
jgi:hypothetical protein